MVSSNLLFAFAAAGISAGVVALTSTDLAEPVRARARSFHPTITPELLLAAAPPAIVSPPEPKPRCGDSMVELGRYCVDRYEAFLVERRGGEIVRHPYFDRPKDGVRYEARNEAGAYPQAYISRVESAAACEHAGKRLCTLAEWRGACEGPRRTPYPYGAVKRSGACNTEKAHLLTLKFGADPGHWHYEDFNAPELSREPGFLAKSGAYDQCVSETGVADLVGNVHEWVSDEADRRMVAELGIDGSLRSWQPWAPGNGVFVGGFYSTREENGKGCEFTTVAHEPSYHDYSTGFRCCADVAP